MVKPNSLSGGKRRKPRKAPAKRIPVAKTPAPAQSPAPQVDTEKRILSAARKEFISKGLDGARMQAVATEAGVNKALLHYYYRSKEKLYAKVLEDTLATVWGRLVEEFRKQKPDLGLEPLLRTVVSTYIRTLAANPEFPLFIFREMASGGSAFRDGIPDLLNRFKDIPITMARVLGEEVKAGKIKPIQPVHFFMNMMGMTVATFLIMPMIKKLGPAFGIEIPFDEAFLEERIKTITDTLLNGIRIRR